MLLLNECVFFLSDILWFPLCFFIVNMYFRVIWYCYAFHVRAWQQIASVMLLLTSRLLHSTW